MTVWVVTDAEAIEIAGGGPWGHVPEPYLDGNLDAILATASTPPLGTAMLLPRLPVPYASVNDLAAEIGKRDGWEAQASHKGTGWLTARNRHTNVLLCLGIRDQVDQLDPIVGTYHSAHATLLRLSAWSDATGVSYRHGPGASMVASILALTRGYRRVLQDPATTDYWKPPATIPEWRADPARSVKGPLHRWDMRAAYLAAAAQAELPRRQLRHVGPGEIDLTQPGYVRVVAPRNDRPWFRWMGGPDRQGTLWTVTPLAREMGAAEIVEGWMPQPVSDDNKSPHARLLRPWADTIRDGIRIREGIAGALKAGYAQAIGLLNVPRGSIYRPDWRHLIIGTAQASLIRRLTRVWVETGHYPVAVNVDSVTYAGAGYDQAITAAIGCGDHIGQMVYQGEVTHGS